MLNLDTKTNVIDFSLWKVSCIYWGIINSFCYQNLKKTLLYRSLYNKLNHILRIAVTSFGDTEQKLCVQFSSMLYFTTKCSCPYTILYNNTTHYITCTRPARTLQGQGYAATRVRLQFQTKMEYLEKQRPSKWYIDQIIYLFMTLTLTSANIAYLIRVFKMQVKFDQLDITD